MKRLLALIALSTATPGLSHEFWIQPEQAEIAVGGQINAVTYVGSHFEGEQLPNYASMQRIVDVTLGDKTETVFGPEGQMPALQVPSLGEGLHVLRIQSRDFQLTYESYDKYLAFLEEAQRPELAAEHDARGLPRDGIREVYFRYAKSLVAVGAGGGADRFMGMPFELIALTNPYTQTPGDMRFELRFVEKPLPDAALHIFHRATDGTVDNIRLRTDAAGVVTVPSAKPGFYMVNAIHILPASPRMEHLLGASWQSLWASMTYAVD